MAQYDVNWSARVATVAGTIAVGNVLVDSGSGYVKATSANRTSYGRPDGIAITAGDSNSPVVMVQCGPLSATQSGLSTGSASAVRVSSTGVLERVTTPSSSDEVVGWAETDGRVHVAFGVLTHRVYVDSGGGGGGGTPAGSTGDIQINSSGSFGSLTPGSGVSTFLATPSSANLAAAVTGETGTGALVFGTAPTLSAPVIGTITNTGTLTLPTSTDTLVGRATTDTLTNKTIAGASNTLTVRIANDVSGLGTNVASFLATPSSANLAAALTDETGTGNAVFHNSPTLTTPRINDGTGANQFIVGVPNLAANRSINLPLLTASDTFVFNDFAATLTNKTIAGASNTLSVRIANDVTGLGTGVATFLATPSGANLASALTTALPDTKGGTGLTALGTGVATFLGTPSGANLASALTTALPVSKGGTNQTALGTGLQVLRTNAGATDTEWATVSATPAGSSGDIQTNSAGSFGSLTPGSGVSTWLATPSSANLATAITDETGSGSLVFGTSPTISKPTLSQGVIWNGITTNASTGTLNNVSLSSKHILEFTNATGPTVTGIDATGVVDGEEIIVYSSGGSFVLNHQDASSTAANRIDTGGVAMTIPAGPYIRLRYFSSRWHAPAGLAV